MSPPLASQPLADVAPAHPRPTRRLDPRRRRISYFMLIRLLILCSFTVVAAIFAWQRNQEFTALYHGFVWGTLMVGYLLTLIYARLLPQVRDLDRFAWVQTTTDIGLTAVVVQMSGGTDSGFVSLYLMAVLGAATMGGVREPWVAAGACILLYGTTTTCEVLGLFESISLGRFDPPLQPAEALATFARTTAALLGVTALSSFLNKQLASSALQVVDLRAMNENILRSLGSGVIATDTRGRIVYFNPAARAILGLNDSDLHRPVLELLPGLLPSVDRPKPLQPELGDPQVDERLELHLQTRPGQRVHIRISQSALLDGQGELIGQLINVQDVTRVHDLAEQVRRSERLAALGGLAASVAHEIRNPLAAISGSAELLGTATLHDEDARLLGIISKESARLSKLVTDMLAFTRPRAPQLDTVSLTRIATETIDNFRLDPSNAQIRTELEADPVPPVNVDPNQLCQVLWNLLRNASEAMEGKGLIRLRIRAIAEHDTVELSVTDDGPGIANDQLPHIFDPFFTTKERGTGFGLAIVHRVVQDNGGTIELSSALGTGTSFRLRFASSNAPPSAFSGT